MSFAKKFCAAIPALAALGMVLALAATSAQAQEVLQLAVPSPKYTLGKFEYSPPPMDGWRQIANDTSTLTLVYAEQKDEGSINTLFGVTFEAHDIPENVAVESAAALADLSRRQMVEARKDDLVGQSPIQAVPSLTDIYTYRLLVHAPVKSEPDAYEVYYVATSPDKKQYVVVQCITKTPEYANELYFNEFYGSLPSLKYTGGAVGSAAPAETKKDAAASGLPPAAAAAKDAAAAKPAGH